MSPRRAADAVSHVHVPVRDIDGACEWFERVLRAKVRYRDAAMASVGIGGFVVMLDKAESDGEMTLGVSCNDCDARHADAVAAGAECSSPPRDSSWGTRACYFRGPGRIIVEFEQVRT